MRNLRLVWLLTVVYAAPSLLCAETDTSAWLNVKDSGASGSRFETTAATTAGSKQITVAAPGDFRAGQGIMVSKSNIQYHTPRLWGPKEPYSSCKPLDNAVEIRGYDGSAGSWLVYILEVDSAEPLSFRWCDDLYAARKWNGAKVPVAWDWQKLSNGIEVKFNKRDLQPGHMITFSARDQLVTVIEKIEGNTLTLRDPANRTVKDAVVRHTDTLALQRAIDRAVKEKRNVFVPVGHYRLTTGLQVGGDAIRIEGASGVDTVMDISDGVGSVFRLQGGVEKTVRNFRMIGHTGTAERAGSFRTSSGNGFWACALKACNAVSIAGTERVLIENVHANRMASEAFYSQGPGRTAGPEPKQYTKSLTYLRCSVTDCAANAFNNNDVAENTSVLYCRIDGAPWHAWEGPSRFIRFIGNYVRNAGPVTVGDMSHRPDFLHTLGCGQAVVADNVFEGIGQCGGIAVNHGSTQVVIANNLFINYNGPAITASSFTVRTSYPSQKITITGNIADMTYQGEKPATRAGIFVSASDTIVSNNQVYVRGATDPLVTGISIKEPALNVSVHNNLVRNCAWGIRTGRAQSRVTEVVDAATFLEDGLPLEWRDSHLYRGWNLAWLSGERPKTLSLVDAFDPQTLRFRLAKPHPMKTGDRFEVFPPHSANWMICGNTITGCANPVLLDSNGSETTFFNKNIVSRGQAEGVKHAVVVRGRFSLIGNHISGFDEKGAAAIALYADPFGRVRQNLYRDNVFERCTTAVLEDEAGLWTSSAAGREGLAGKEEQ